MRAAHAALREGTRAEHERLDALLCGFDLGDRESYRAFLEAHAEGVFATEAALADSAGLVVDDWDARQRGDALRADLDTLGHPHPSPPQGGSFLSQREHRVNSPPDCLGHAGGMTVPMLEGAAKPRKGEGEWGAPEAAGALYVLEGSRLGGKFLVKQVGDGFPRAYLGAEQARGQWPALLDALDRVLVDAATTARAIAAARAVFDRFETAARRRLDANPCTDAQNG